MAESVRDMLRRAARERQAELAADEAESDPLIKIENEGGIVLRDCSYLGGCGYPLARADSLALGFCGDELRIHGPDDKTFAVPYPEIAAIEISGPGAVTTGGGFASGGFGVGGAIEGMAIASVLNMLTTKSKIHTFVSIITNAGELYFHYGSMEPRILRIELASVFTVLRRLNQSWRQDRLAALLLAQAEFELSEENLSRFQQRLTEPSKIFSH